MAKLRRSPTRKTSSTRGGDGGSSTTTSSIDAPSFFREAKRLEDAAPWDVVPGDTALRVDATGLKRTGLAVTIIGQSGDSFGALIFDSLEAQRRFVEAGRRGHGFTEGFVAISYDTLDEMPPAVIAAVRRMGRVPSGVRIPSVMALRGGRPVAAGPNDYRLATLVAHGLARFFETHRVWPGEGEGEGDARGWRVTAELAGFGEVAVWPSGLEPVAATRKPPAKPEAFLGAAPKPTTVDALRRVLGTWSEEFYETRYPAEAHTLRDDVALLDRLARRRGDDILALMGSLPSLWGAFWRPLASGATGAELARKSPKLAAPVLVAAIERIARARAVYGEVVEVRLGASTVVLRDLFDGAVYAVPVELGVASRLHRWARVLTVLVEVGDGTWHHPSTFTASTGLRHVTPEALLAQAREAITALGGDPRNLDTLGPHAGLRRWVVAVLPTLASAERLERANVKKKFLVNAAGHRAVFHKASAALSAAARKALVAKLRARPDVVSAGGDDFVFVGDGEGEERVQRVLVTGTQAAGRIGARPRAIELSTDSVERYARLTEVLDGIADQPLAWRVVERVRPWEGREGFAEIESDDTERVVVAGGVVENDARAANDAPPSAASMTLEHLRAALDFDVPAVGGVPRARVATAEGRAAVEAWLRRGEMVSGRGSGGFVDLDPLRLELGLPTVASSIPR